MYDKGNNLRIEVTINNPKDFKVMKEKEKIIEHKEIIKEKVWTPMGKSISNLYRYVEISKSIIKRYIDALPEIDLNKPTLNEIKKVSENPLPKNENGYGNPLGHKQGKNLTGFLKIKLLRYGVRVVYLLVREKTTMRIIVIGARKNEEVYKIADKRKQKYDL